MRKLACAFFECSRCPLNSDHLRHEGGCKLCPLHAFYIWHRVSAPAGMCVKPRRRHKCQEGSAERNKVPRAILVYGLLGTPALPANHEIRFALDTYARPPDHKLQIICGIRRPAGRAIEPPRACFWDRSFPHPQHCISFLPRMPPLAAFRRRDAGAPGKPWNKIVFCAVRCLGAGQPRRAKIVYPYADACKGQCKLPHSKAPLARDAKARDAGAT